MRKCYNDFCLDGYEVDEDGIPTSNECSSCQGTGKVEDACYCFAFEPSECCCGYDWGDHEDEQTYQD